MLRSKESVFIGHPRVKAVHDKVDVERRSGQVSGGGCMSLGEFSVDGVQRDDRGAHCWRLLLARQCSSPLDECRRTRFQHFEAWCESYSCASEYIKTSWAVGAAVAERLACSPPTKANRFQSPAGPLPGFRMLGIVPGDVAGRFAFNRPNKAVTNFFFHPAWIGRALRGGVKLPAIHSALELKRTCSSERLLKSGRHTPGPITRNCRVVKYYPMGEYVLCACIGAGGKKKGACYTSRATMPLIVIGSVANPGDLSLVLGISKQNSHGFAAFVRLVFHTTSQEHDSAVGRTDDGARGTQAAPHVTSRRSAVGSKGHVADPRSAPALPHTEPDVRALYPALHALRARYVQSRCIPVFVTSTYHSFEDSLLCTRYYVNSYIFPDLREKTPKLLPLLHLTDLLPRLYLQTSTVSFFAIPLLRFPLPTSSLHVHMHTLPSMDIQASTDHPSPTPHTKVWRVTSGSLNDQQYNVWCWLARFPIASLLRCRSSSFVYLCRTPDKAWPFISSDSVPPLVQLGSHTHKK
ncbi:hypothetical protein PR048_033582 [Dryococelus australis]|uniref:Uncharacterized protein n=1 Tax=Dryococelus australis TaxID=614101 RepID=A0ABQ9G1K5_9NEOP|nr:hypothetical protein PR048_033582 [Dryococelus australis]